MDIKRTFHAKLDKWLSSRLRKPLLVRGARQVGKSYTVRAWCREQAAPEQYLEINFEERPALKQIFQQDLNPVRILAALQLSTGVNLNKPGSILFMDEIQACPEAMTALRYFAEKMPELPVIAAGSLIDFVLEKISFPVGRVDNLVLCPLSFREFLGGIGKLAIASNLAALTLSEPLPSALQLEMLDDLRTYFRVGGMPEAVSVYAESKDLADVSKIHSRLVRSYKDDFAKYATHHEWGTLELVFDKIPNRIGANRVNYSKFDPAIRGEKIKKALNLLLVAGLCHKVIATQADRLPLLASSDERFFKLLSLDIGIMQHLLGFDWRTLEPATPLTSICDGAFAEQFIGQEVIAMRSEDKFYQPYYWYRAVKGSEAEVDYVLEHLGAPTPLEVKSGMRGTLKSLALYQDKFHPKTAYVLSERNIEKRDNVIWLPLFLVGNIT